MWETVNTLPAFFPDGRPLDKKVSPWLINGIIRANYEKLKTDLLAFTRTQNFISKFIVWFLVPITLCYFWIKYLVSHDWSIICIHILCIAFASSFGIRSFAIARKTIRGQERDAFYWKNILKNRNVWKTVIGFAAILLAFFLVSYYAINGIPPDRGTGSRTWIPDILSFVHFSPFANLADQDISIRPENLYNVPMEDMESSWAKGADLKGRDLRYADARRAFLVFADFRNANLEGIDFRGADLRHADFRGANLKKALFNGAKGQGANFENADLRAATIIDFSVDDGAINKAIIDSTLIY